VRRVKLIFVGHGGGGKTTLVKRLRTGLFAERPGATDGIEMLEWKERAWGPEVAFSVLDCGMCADEDIMRTHARQKAGHARAHTSLKHIVFCLSHACVHATCMCNMYV
jgi:GTPase SAR1 family protein